MSDEPIIEGGPHPTCQYCPPIPTQAATARTGPGVWVCIERNNGFV